MDDHEKKHVLKKYFVNGRLQKKDYDRLVEKLVKAYSGEAEYSGFTGTALQCMPTAYQAQEKDDLSRGGSGKTKNEGVIRATLELLDNDPDIKPKQAFDLIPSVDLLRWSISMFEGDLVTTYQGTDLPNGRKRESRPLGYESYRTSYFYEVRKEFRKTVS